MTSPDDAQRFAALFAARETPTPTLRDTPTHVRGFRVRIELSGSDPVIWRSVELPGDMTLDVVHRIIQAAMGWEDSHLHRFRTGVDYQSGHFLTEFDTREGDVGIPEAEVRLDQVVSTQGDQLWYEYDFGDSWEHVLTIESVSDAAPASPVCTGGQHACPPEDCGGVWAYAELAEWVRNGFPANALPPQFDDSAHARAWLPAGWHPDEFDVAAASEAVRAASVAPPRLAAPLATLMDQLTWRGAPPATKLLSSLAVAATDSSEQAEVSEQDASAMLEPFLILLDVVGDGLTLTQAGRLRPAVVTELAERTGVGAWWIGTANREDHTWPVAQLREVARDLGLVTVRKGTLTATAAGRRLRDNPLSMWRHVLTRLPSGRGDFETQAGWLSLAIVASGAPAESWDTDLTSLVLALGWRSQGPFPEQIIVHNPTLAALEILAGSTRTGRVSGPHPAVAATARAVIFEK